jgi:hypothetical protein
VVRSGLELEAEVKPMKSMCAKRRLAVGLTVCVLALNTVRAGEGSKGITWHFPVGLQYASGFSDVMDAIEDQNFQGYDLDSFMIPVGLFASPYMEFGFGLGIGVSLGPTMFVAVEEYYSGGWDSADYFTYIVPIGVDLRYTLFREGKVSPYVRAGFRYPIAGGDFVDEATPGFNGAVGVEVFRGNDVGFGFEVGYDTSEVSIESRYFGVEPRTVKPVELTVSVFAVF